MRILAAVTPRKPDELLECFAVAPNLPLVSGVLHVLLALEQTAIEAGGMAQLGAEERAFHGGRVTMARDAQEQVLGLIEQANAAKRR